MTMKEYVDYIEICGEKVTAQDGSDIIKRMNRKRKKASILLRKIKKCCQINSIFSSNKSLKENIGNIII